MLAAAGLKWSVSLDRDPVLKMPLGRADEAKEDRGMLWMDASSADATVYSLRLSR